MSFREIFKDDNKYNEKNIVGFGSFTIMIIFAIADIVSGLMGRPFAVSDTIFTSFVVVTLGSFGIAEAGKVFYYKRKKDEDHYEY
jgi:tetrahydromethanopterin S-methyltransferase subunit E